MASPDSFHQSRRPPTSWISEQTGCAIAGETMQVWRPELAAVTSPAGAEADGDASDSQRQR
jgi:hypothetical protein